MLQHATKAAHGVKRSGKTPAIITKLELVRLARASMPETPPPLTRRMRYNWPRPGI
jgi:hypothetical protein